MAREVVTPNGFAGSDSERIAEAVRVGAAEGLTVSIPRRNESADGVRERWVLDEAIQLPGHLDLELDNCHLKLSDACRDNFIRSANCGLGITEVVPLENITIRGRGRVVLEGADHPRATGDGAKVVGEQSYGTDGGKPGVSQRCDWRNIGILLANVTGFRLENLHLRDYHAWGVSLERCAEGVVRDLSFHAPGWKLIDGQREPMLNQDGLDLRYGCHDILVDGITGDTGDDLVALTAIAGGKAGAGSDQSTQVTGTHPRPDGADDIRRITVRNVRGKTSSRQVVRLLNTRELRLYDILIDGVVDTSTPDRPDLSTIKIGSLNPGYGGVTPFGNTARVIINNVISNSTHAVLVGGSLIDSIITNVVMQKPGGEPVKFESGEDLVANLTINNIVQPAG